MEELKFIWKMAWTIIWIVLGWKLLLIGWFFWRASENEKKVLAELWRQSQTPMEFDKAFKIHINKTKIEGSLPKDWDK